MIRMASNLGIIVSSKILANANERKIETIQANAIIRGWSKEKSQNQISNLLAIFAIINIFI